MLDGMWSEPLPSHVGNLGNEKADGTTKSALSLSVTPMNRLPPSMRRTCFYLSCGAQICGDISTRAIYHQNANACPSPTRRVKFKIL